MGLVMVVAVVVAVISYVDDGGTRPSSTER